MWLIRFVGDLEAVLETRSRLQLERLVLLSVPDVMERRAGNLPCLFPFDSRRAKVQSSKEVHIETIMNTSTKVLSTS